MPAKCNIVEDGFWRLLKGQRNMKPVSPYKYQAELAKATPEQKQTILRRLEEDVERHHKMAGHKPSPKAVW